MCKDLALLPTHPHRWPRGESTDAALPHHSAEVWCHCRNRGCTNLKLQGVAAGRYCTVICFDRSIVRRGRLFSVGPSPVGSVFICWHGSQNHGACSFCLAVLPARRFSVGGCGCAHPDGVLYQAAVFAVPRGRAPRCSVSGLATRCRELVVASGCRQRCLCSCGFVRVVGMDVMRLNAAGTPCEWLFRLST